MGLSRFWPELPENMNARLDAFRAAQRKRRQRRRQQKFAANREAALIRRSQLTGTTFIGISGSHGKTTTTTLLGEILSGYAPTMMGHHFNTVLAAIATVSQVKPKHRYCVQEVGLSGPGLMEGICQILQPSVAIITAISGDHRSAFKTLDATTIEKGRLVEAVPPDGLAVLNADDPRVRGMANRCKGRVVFYGRAEMADLRLVKASATWPERLTLVLRYRGDEFTVRTRLVSDIWAPWIMGAILAALELGVPREHCVGVAEAFAAVNNRMSVHRSPTGATYVLDAVKASALGLDACLAFLADAQATRRTVVFGTVADYAGSARSEYNRVARMVMARADRAFFIGPSANRVRHLAALEFADRLFVIEDVKEASARIAADTIPGELVYIKSSGADHIERVLLSQTHDVGCWLPRCGRQGSCIGCRHVEGYRIALPRRFRAPVETGRVE